MIVDDNDPMRGILRQFVRGMPNHHEIYECRDGLEAVEAFHRLQPEWVLMDIKLPKMDGLAATKAIRREFPSARIIIVTNFDDVTFQHAARESGAVGYILKDRLSELHNLMV